MSSVDAGRPRLSVRPLPIRLDRNVRRVVALPFDVRNYARTVDLFARVDGLPDDEVERALDAVILSFGGRHRDLESSFDEHYRSAARHVGDSAERSRERRLLLGGYFTMEYSIEAAALFNPSIVPHPDQRGLPDGALRFVMSLRAVGEGHLSSTVFHTGVLLRSGAMAIDPSGPYSDRARVDPDRRYHKGLFARKLRELGCHSEVCERVLARLPELFELAALEAAVAAERRERGGDPELEQAVAGLLGLARANYTLELGPAETLNDLIMFPCSQVEASGIEDLRLVRFVEEDGTATYFGTYTAFDGTSVLPMLLETSDFRTLAIQTLNGASVRNKGLALFPRRIDGHYVMCSRNDGRNLFLMFSDHVHFWESHELLAAPQYPWELGHIGNCGSPIETEAGWLLVTHGAGPMRRYCIGAMLLDRADPFRIRGRLREPLLTPSEEDREGYVPNVVYSCGSLVHNGQLVLPYAVSDTATRVATVPLAQLLERLLQDGA